jgi:N-acetylmuramoyl-L-alanine amidase
LTHFGIELVGNHYETLLGRLPNEVGAHCRGMNQHSIGICFVGNFDIEEPPDDQLVVGRKLIRFLMEVFDIPNEYVKGHCDFSQKSCPGRLFPLGEFVRGL